MNREQVIQVLAMLKAAFPHSFKDLGRRDLETMINLWQTQFDGEDPQLVSAAVNSLIATRQNGYSPTIGEIKAQMHRIAKKDELSESSAWAMVSKACANGLYGYREEFEKLPEDVQRAVGAPEQLKAWAMMDSEAVESVVASNFMRNYRTMQQRKKENDMLPPAVKAFIGSVSDNMKLEAPKANRPQLMPAKLEPIQQGETKIRMPDREEYKPPDEESWEKKREAMLKMIDSRI